jgi:D-beta-D-heptose 7-phosphate kinase/D-beta-D-heptose 1-phosphate adenosyltransferase
VKKLLGKISTLRIIVIGDVMLDHYIAGDATRISPEAPVPVVAVSGETYAPGAAANVALNTRRIGCAVELIGSIGDDHGGEIVKQMLGESGIAFSERFSSTAIGTLVKTRVVVRWQQL